MGISFAELRRDMENEDEAQIQRVLINMRE